MTTPAPASKAILIPKAKATAERKDSGGSGLVVKVDYNKSKGGMSTHDLMRVLTIATTASSHSAAQDGRPGSPSSPVEFTVGSYNDKFLPGSFVDQVLVSAGFHAKAKSPKALPQAASVKAPTAVVAIAPRRRK